MVHHHHEPPLSIQIKHTTSVSLALLENILAIPFNHLPSLNIQLTQEKYWLFEDTHVLTEQDPLDVSVATLSLLLISLYLFIYISYCCHISCYHALISHTLCMYLIHRVTF